MRQLRAAGSHWGGFVFTAAIMFVLQGSFPFWLGIWGVVLVAQTIGAVPAAWALWQRRHPALGFAPGGPAQAARADLPAAKPALALPLPPPPRRRSACARSSRSPEGATPPG